MKKHQKNKLLDTLREYPVIKTSCEKCNIGRATYYRWCQDDEMFAAAASKALKEGILLVNDISEENLITMVRDSELPAIKYWLRHHHDTYSGSGYFPIVYTKGGR